MTVGLVAHRIANQRKAQTVLARIHECVALEARRVNVATSLEMDHLDRIQSSKLIIGTVIMIRYVRPTLVLPSRPDPLARSGSSTGSLVLCSATSTDLLDHRSSMRQIQT